MPSPAFGPFFEIFSEGVVLTVAVITTFAFAERCWKRSVPLNLTGFIASAIAVFYALYGLTYWFNGMEGYDCTTLAAVNGTCMSASNALTFLHLFVKAEVSNRRNVRWRRCLRWVGVGTTMFNWATLIVVHALLHGVEVEGLDGPRCQFVFEMTSFKLKWIAQFVNQGFQVVAFVWPLIAHIRLMEGGAQKIGKKDTVFKNLVMRALAASGISLAFTVVITTLAFTKIAEMDAGTNNLVIPIFPLAVLDNAVNLGAIFFAINIKQEDDVSSDGRTRIGSASESDLGGSTRSVHGTHNKPKVCGGASPPTLAAAGRTNSASSSARAAAPRLHPSLGHIV